MQLRPYLVSGSLQALVARFAVIGVASGAIFAATTSLAIGLLHVRPEYASIIGYCVSVPLNFVGHRRFTFRSSNAWALEALRFLCLHLVNIAVTALAMNGAVRHLHLGYGWGIVAAVILVPAVNFTISHLWVFRRRGTSQP